MPIGTLAAVEWFLIAYAIFGITSSTPLRSSCAYNGAKQQRIKTGHSNDFVLNYQSLAEWLGDFIIDQRKWCGKPVEEIKLRRKSKGFQPTSHRSWPWVVSLHIKEPNMATELLSQYPAKYKSHANGLLKTNFTAAVPGHACWGTLISRKFILTSAHCLQFEPFTLDWKELLDDFTEKCSEETPIELCEEKFLKYAERIIKTGREWRRKELSEILPGLSKDMPESWQVRLGFSNGRTGQHDVKPVNVKQIILHPDARGESSAYENDLALLELKEPISYSKTIRPICIIGNQQFKKNYDKCAVAAWGEDYGRRQLMHTPYKLVERKKCTKAVRKYPIFVELNLKSPKFEHQICAVEHGHRAKKTPEVKTKPCYGDSGGPLICKSCGRWYQVGITTYGRSRYPDTCEEERSPDIFIHTPKFTSWILKTMWNTTKIP